MEVLLRRVRLDPLLFAALLLGACASEKDGAPHSVAPGYSNVPDGAPATMGGGAASPTFGSGDAGITAPGSSGADGGAGAQPGAQSGSASGPVTYQKNIRSVLVANCVECHTKGGIGPADLSDWATVKSLAPSIVGAVGAGRMPPWPANDACHDIADSRALSRETKQLFERWKEEGYLEGSASDYVEPPRRHRQDLGPADLVMKAPEPFTPAASADTYRCFYLGTLARDMYVTALDLIPGQRAEVHHIQLHRVDALEALAVEAQDTLDPGPGYICDAAGVGLTSSQNMFSYRPGALAVVLNQGDAVYFRGGSGLVLQIHYNTQFLPVGERPAPDQSSVAMWTLPEGETPEHVVYRTGALAPLSGDGSLNPVGFVASSIPANASQVVGEATVSMADLSSLGLTFLPGEIVGMTPHAHAWATRMVARLKPANGSEQCLVDVPDWDFNWQLDYMFKAGVPYTENDSVHIQCDYDNTADNQPMINGMRTPVRTITFGEKTLNEMCLHYLWLRFDYEAFAAANG